MKNLMVEQRREITRAIIGSGEYRLRKGYEHLSIEPSKWFKITTQHRQRKDDWLMKAAVKDELDQSILWMF